MSHDDKPGSSGQGRGRIDRGLKPTRDPDDLIPATKLPAPPPSSRPDGKPTLDFTHSVCESTAPTRGR